VRSPRLNPAYLLTSRRAVGQFYVGQALRILLLDKGIWHRCRRERPEEYINLRRLKGEKVLPQGLVLKKGENSRTGKGRIAFLDLTGSHR